MESGEPNEGLSLEEWDHYHKWSLTFTCYDKLTEKMRMLGRQATIDDYWEIWHIRFKHFLTLLDTRKK